MSKKSYSSFTAEDLKMLGLSIQSAILFSEIVPVEPSAWLKQTFHYNGSFPVSSEKARSELLIMPLLVELKQRNPDKLTVFSGYQFDVDRKKGLNGFCDYLLSNKSNAVFVESPIIALAEVKKEQDLLQALPQCIAEMYAAKIFNERHKNPVAMIYGVVTTGYEWLFITLKEQQVIIDNNRYYIRNLNELLGVWQKILDQF
ncbi:MAG: hypothetical protein H7A23_17400 [Leptospiraceae bacterium]|nr:hypothetical protein [Leptospiraceae bacterium]MCP5496325.1 hypothetical protein [Leptospiraceae bacterium]